MSKEKKLSPVKVAGVFVAGAVLAAATFATGRSTAITNEQTPPIAKEMLYSDEALTMQSGTDSPTVKSGTDSK